MSTRSNIYLKLKDKSKGKTIKFNFSKLPRGNGERHAELEFPINDVTIPQDAEYIGVYHHWDGYITGVGKTLLESYTDYGTILNLLIMGDISTINGGVISYQGWRNEDTPPQFINKSTKFGHWIWNEEKQCGEVKKFEMCNAEGELDPKAAVCEEYAYLFDGKKWWVSYYTYDNNDKRVDTGWLDLKEELAKWEERENKANA
jgi:hypothetical protein